MKRPNNVLIGVALFLLAFVILYNVFFPNENFTEYVDETTTIVEKTTEQSERKTTIYEDSTTISETTVSNYGKININTASLEELQALSGIGPKKAQAIIDYRTQNGNFASPEELINVSGIGEKTLAKIIDSITV